MLTGISGRAYVRAQSPGAREAIERGCTCDPVANCDGEGRRGTSGTRLFVPDEECPLHGLHAVFGFNGLSRNLASSYEHLLTLRRLRG